jgi:hypothetical protein
MSVPTGATALCMSTLQDDPFLVIYGSSDGSVTVGDLRKPDRPWAHNACLHGGAGMRQVIYVVLPPVPCRTISPAVSSIVPVERSPFFISASDDGTVGLLELSHINSFHVADGDGPVKLFKDSSLMTGVLPITSVDIAGGDLVGFKLPYACLATSVD